MIAASDREWLEFSVPRESRRGGPGRSAFARRRPVADSPPVRRLSRSIQEEVAMPESVPSSLIIDAFKEIFQAERRGNARQDPLGWIISVPDTHQKTVLAALDKEESIRVVTCATEDEATAIAAGLHVGGEPVVLMIPARGPLRVDQYAPRSRD